jgi:hypothetical protein
MNYSVNATERKLSWWILSILLGLLVMGGGMVSTNYNMHDGDRARISYNERVLDNHASRLERLEQERQLMIDNQRLILEALQDLKSEVKNR